MPLALVSVVCVLFVQAALVLAACFITMLLRRGGSKRHANAHGGAVPDDCVTEDERRHTTFSVSNAMFNVTPKTDSMVTTASRGSRGSGGAAAPDNGIGATRLNAFDEDEDGYTIETNIDAVAAASNTNMADGNADDGLYEEYNLPAAVPESDDYLRPQNDPYDLAESDVAIDRTKQLGKGNYGVVYQGQLSVDPRTTAQHIPDKVRALPSWSCSCGNPGVRIA